MKEHQGIALAALFVAAAPGAEVLVLKSGDGPADQAVVQVLTAQGHGVTLGPRVQEFDGSLDLAPYGTIVILYNANWGDGMPDAGETKLKGWLEAGGGLVTGEWVAYYSDRGVFPIIRPLLPFSVTAGYSVLSDDRYTAKVKDPVLNAGLPNQFDFPLVSFSGTETFVTPSNGASVFYESRNVGAGLIGWEHDGARVLMFTSTLGPDQVKDAQFKRLLSNAVDWAALNCYADFTGDGSLDLFDFLGYVNAFNGDEPSADCDQNGSLDLFDFLCFVNAFNGGC